MNTVSAEAFIINIEKTFGWNDGARRNDIVMFLGEIIQAIKCYLPMDKVWETIIIKDGRGRLPCHLNNLIKVVDSGNNQLFQTTYAEAYDTSTTYPIDGGYALNPGYIIAPFNKGTVKVFYSKIPRDSKGLPLIIDDFDYKEACKWGVLSMILSNGEKHPVFTYNMAFDKFDNVYLPRAQGAMKMEQWNDEAFGRAWKSSFGEIKSGAANYQVDNGYGLPDYVAKPLDISNLHN